MKCYLLLLIFLATISRLNSAKIVPNSRSSTDRLAMVIMLHRHGDRSPISTYVNDPYRGYRWPGGYGALSRKGARQLFDLGTNIRSRYESLKPWDGVYTQEIVHAVSSSPERCIMSGNSMHAAFWAPYEFDNFLPIPWQPIPLNVLPAGEDYVLYQAESKCPRYDQIYTKLLTDPDPSSDFYAYNQRLGILFQYLTEKTGQNVTNIQEAGAIQDVLAIEDGNGFELPAWTVPVYPQMLSAVRFRAFQLITETSYMKTIRGGPIFTLAYNQMVDTQNGRSSLRIVTYSAHDTTIFNLINSMRMTEQIGSIPNYAALLAFEMYENSDSGQENTVQMVYYPDSTATSPKQLDIPGCPSPCYVSQLGYAFSDLLIDDYDEACEL